MAYNNYSEKGYQQLAGYSTTPAANTADKEKTPTYVIITSPGTFAFSYPDGTTGTTTSSYITGGLVDDTNGPVKLDINPVKWVKTSGTPLGGTVGEVIFVYRRMG